MRPAACSRAAWPSSPIPVTPSTSAQPASAQADAISAVTEAVEKSTATSAPATLSAGEAVTLTPAAGRFAASPAS